MFSAGSGLGPPTALGSQKDSQTGMYYQQYLPTTGIPLPFNLGNANGQTMIPQQIMVPSFPQLPQHIPSQNNFIPINQSPVAQTSTNLMEYSDSEEEPSGSNNDWQDARRHKRKRLRQTNKTQSTETNQITQSNRFSLLAVQDEAKEQSTEEKQDKTPKPPPIFVQGVTHYPKMIENFKNIAEDEQYSTKSLANNVVKISPNTPETYKKFIKYMQETNIIHHTYQMKTERAYRVVIKHLHQTVPINDIQTELTELGHKVRNIINIRNRKTKLPLPIFFVDLEPASNNKEIYKLKFLQNKSIVVEPPRQNTELPQCTRCQNYNHTKTYCNRPYACVKCGGSHDSKTCKKTRDTPATCALCQGSHPANYRGCNVYQELQKNNGNANQRRINLPTRIGSNYQTQSQGNHVSAHVNPNLLYSKTLQGNINPQQHDGNTQPAGDITFTHFLNEFKAMFNQLIQQNSMILNMLSTVISKLVA